MRDRVEPVPDCLYLHGEGLTIALLRADPDLRVHSLPTGRLTDDCLYRICESGKRSRLERLRNRLGQELA